jgi:hypothetical protein
MEKWTVEEMTAQIDMKGFDYFFRYYVSLSDLPEEIRKEAQKYVKVADNLEEALVKIGVEL